MTSKSSSVNTNSNNKDESSGDHHYHHHQHHVRFDVHRMQEHFESCIIDNGEDIDLNNYIIGYQELYHFLIILGSVFSWVASDVHSKLENLRSHLSSSSSSSYKTLSSMLDFESESGRINHKSRDMNSGSRNLLRLHRALDFIAQFLQLLPDMQDDDKTCGSCQQVYKRTLSRYHPWVVQKGAMMAMHMLPTKGGLIHKIAEDSEEERQRLQLLFPKAVQALRKVFELTHAQYEKRALLNLP